MMSHSLCVVRRWATISKLMVIGLAEVYISFLECDKIGRIQEMGKGILRMGPCSSFNFTLPDWRATGTRLCALCLVQWPYKTQLLSHGSYNLVEGAGDRNLEPRIWREPCEWSLGSAKTSRIVHKLDLYKWGCVHMHQIFPGNGSMAFVRF